LQHGDVAVDVGAAMSVAVDMVAVMVQWWLL
jgi:hypothetical protein